jgi:hypothetical protein
MSLTIEFCEARAREAGTEADSASLEAMADRANDVAKARALKEFQAQKLREREEHEKSHEERDIGYE